ncbi:MAG: hypothetical protein ACRD1V_08920 [Vicinamibacterales bacterium]
MRPRDVRVVRIIVMALVAATLVAIVCGAAYVGLIEGWHPIPGTSVGCALHKRFHASDLAPVSSRELGLETGCLNVLINGQRTVVQDPRVLQRARAWFDARSDLWSERFLTATALDEPAIEIERCSELSGPRVSVSEDWIEFVPSKGLRRPICQGEWRALALILK